MTNSTGPTSRSRNKAAVLVGEAAPLSRHKALLQFPPCVYVARLSDGTIKIGWTSNVAKRLGRLGPSPELLALKPGTLDDEAEIHDRLRGLAVRGREYYDLSGDVVAVVNELRQSAGLPHLDAA